MTGQQDPSPESRPSSLALEQELSSLDAEFIRVLEDLIDALLAKGTLLVTDLPPEALEKLQQRKHARQRLKNALDLIDDAPLI
ncbi:MAG: hypothetical protein WBC18_24420 [Ottowia sp.]|uniref:hypothetical protein n=1 Tax=Ottowia sp. TaxID=1898956 RepID=UPI003C7062F2